MNKKILCLGIVFMLCITLFTVITQAVVLILLGQHQSEAADLNQIWLVDAYGRIIVYYFSTVTCILYVFYTITAILIVWLLWLIVKGEKIPKKRYNAKR
jgi:hypothetical protein